MTAARVTEASKLTNHVRYLNTVSARLDKIQEELSTGRRIERASEDPAGAALALQYRSSIDFEVQMRRNLQNGVSFMNVTEAALSAATDSLQRVRELTVQAANGTLSQQERDAIAAEVNQHILQLAQVANANFGDAYIFSGHLTRQAAFQIVGGSTPTAITYQGDTGQRVRRISREDTVAVNVNGQQAFGTMFTDLIALRDNLTSGAPVSAISSSLATIDTALDGVLKARAEIGARLNRFEASEKVSEQADINLQQLRSTIEEVDLPSAIIRLRSQQNAMEAALGAIGRTADMSLLNFLR